ncbi:pantoate--beta-alanine ligase [Kaarinaea lacus]
MRVVSTIAEIREVVRQWREVGETIGFVPTMGNLHEGHLRLVEEAHERADHVVVSIFVNPMQFTDASGNGGDFERYPRTLEADQKKLSALGIKVDIVFAPSVKEVYPDGFENETRVEVPGLSDILCGAFRPGHFTGVATVVAKLFNMVQPHVAIFGEKDFQQLLVIRRMVSDLCFPVEIVGMPTVREHDRLAMSSRNQYLDKEERDKAALLNQLLVRTRHRIQKGSKNYQELEEIAFSELEESGFKPEYFTVRNAHDLQPASSGDKDLVILAAAWLGKARLIDNIRVR